MRDRGRILAALLLFVAIVTAPFWSALRSSRHVVTAPNLSLPAQAKECVAPAAVMRTRHMQMLASWREDVVRRGDRRYVAFDGKVYDKNLTRTCLGCHDKQEFCDRCHAYAGVSEPYCWNCHHAPKAGAARSLP